MECQSHISTGKQGRMHAIERSKSVLSISVILFSLLDSEYYDYSGARARGEESANKRENLHLVLRVGSA